VAFIIKKCNFYTVTVLINLFLLKAAPDQSMAELEQMF